MKYFILLLLLGACGKHEMPGEKDLADNDGDQTPNYLEVSEFEKNVADITPFGTVTAELRFHLNQTGLEKNTIELSNDLDLSRYSQDLMVKNLSALQIEDYFSEFSVLRVKNKRIIEISSLESIKARIFLNNVENATDLYLIHGKKRTHLGKVKEPLDLNLNKEIIEKLLNGESFLALSNNNLQKFKLDIQTQSVQDKTYRVFINDGVTSKIFYVAKTYSFDKFLKHFNINHPVAIEKFSLLSSTYEVSPDEWWTRTLNQQDKVVVLANLKSLSEHYLKGFTKVNSKISRINGYASTALVLERDSLARTLFKIRLKQTQRTFATKTIKETYRNGRAMEGDFWTCKNSYRTIIGETELAPEKKIISENTVIKLNETLYTGATLVPGADAKGPYWELEAPAGSSKVQIRLKNLASSEYVQLGRYASKCDSNRDRLVEFHDNLHATEGQLTLEIEALVEKL